MSRSSDDASTGWVERFVEGHLSWMRNPDEHIPDSFFIWIFGLASIGALGVIYLLGLLDRSYVVTTAGVATTMTVAFILTNRIISGRLFRSAFESPPEVVERRLRKSLPWVFSPDEDIPDSFFVWISGLAGVGALAVIYLMGLLDRSYVVTTAGVAAVMAVTLVFINRVVSGRVFR